MKNKKVILLGFPNPIRMKNKKYVLERLYDRAQSNPFISGKTFDEYREFLCKQIKEFEGKDIEPDDTDEIYDTLKSMGWIKVVSAVLIAVISAHTAIA
tara:strand:+ start:2054 stop:2347 length:294 start_codon:yes stop_codon:yes gene_type:complete